MGADGAGEVRGTKLLGGWLLVLILLLPLAKLGSIVAIRDSRMLVPVMQNKETSLE